MIQPAHVIGHNARDAALEGTESADTAPAATLAPHLRSIHTFGTSMNLGSTAGSLQRIS